LLTLLIIISGRISWSKKSHQHVDADDRLDKSLSKPGQLKSPSRGEPLSHSHPKQGRVQRFSKDAATTIRQPQLPPTPGWLQSSTQHADTAGTRSLLLSALLAQFPAPWESDPKSVGISKGLTQPSVKLYPFSRLSRDVSEVNGLPQPPPRPAYFRTPRELYIYLRELRAHYDLMSRPR
jgi:hypothetical protein